MLAKMAEVGSDNLGSHGVRILIPSNNYTQATQKKEHCCVEFNTIHFQIWKYALFSFGNCFCQNADF